MVSSLDDRALDGFIAYVKLIGVCALCAVVFSGVGLGALSAIVWIAGLVLGLYFLNSRSFVGLGGAIGRCFSDRPVVFGLASLVSVAALVNTQVHFFNLFYRSPLISGFIEDRPLLLGVHDHGVAFAFLCCFGFCFYLFSDQPDHLKERGVFGRIQ